MSEAQNPERPMIDGGTDPEPVPVSFDKPTTPPDTGTDTPDDVTTAEDDAAEDPYGYAPHEADPNDPLDVRLTALEERVRHIGEDTTRKLGEILNAVNEYQPGALDYGPQDATAEFASATGHNDDDPEES